MTPMLRDNSNEFNKNNNNMRNLESMLPDFGDMLSYFQVYPDRFIDYILPEDSTFQLYPFQRIFLRVLSRYKKVYI